MGPSSNSQSRLPSPAFSENPHSNDPSRSPTPPAGPKQPMQLGGARVSPTERQRRVKGLCIYCGQAGHFLTTCPIRQKKKAQLQEESWWAKPVPPPNPLNFRFSSLRLCWSQETLPLLVLVDSGVDDHFIDSMLVPQAGIPTEIIASPKDVNSLDSKLLAWITHCTVPITLVLSIITKPSSFLSFPLLTHPAKAQEVAGWPT